MSDPLQPIDQAAILRASVVNGLINAVINGLIQVVLLRGQGPVALSADAISSTEHTVLASAVPLAVSLAMILTAVGHFTGRPPRRPFFPAVAGLILKHGFFAFGIVVAGAVVWQRLAGTITVSTGTAALILGLIAGVAAAVIHYLTIIASSEMKP